MQEKQELSLKITVTMLQALIQLESADSRHNAKLTMKPNRLPNKARAARRRWLLAASSDSEENEAALPTKMGPLELEV